MIAYQIYNSIVGYLNIIFAPQIHAIPLGSPDSSVGKESAFSAGDPISIPGSERLAGKGIGYPL